MARDILIVDDDNIFPLTLRDALEKDGFSVRLSDDGVQALVEVEKQKPDMIILDLMMPKMGGFPFLEKLNEKYPDTKIPVLISTSLSDSRNISEGVSFGVQGYIVKSEETLETIVLRVKRILGE
jgi:CheY-like chemotaxis protein